MSAADRIRECLKVPLSLMGGESFSFSIHDLRELLEEHERMKQELARLKSA